VKSLRKEKLPPVLQLATDSPLREDILDGRILSPANNIQSSLNSSVEKRDNGESSSEEELPDIGEYTLYTPPPPKPDALQTTPLVVDTNIKTEDTANENGDKVVNQKVRSRTPLHLSEVQVLVEKCDSYSSLKNSGPRTQDEEAVGRKVINSSNGRLLGSRRAFGKRSKSHRWFRYSKRRFTNATSIRSDTTNDCDNGSNNGFIGRNFLHVDRTHRSSLLGNDNLGSGEPVDSEALRTSFAHVNRSLDKVKQSSSSRKKKRLHWRQDPERLARYMKTFKRKPKPCERPATFLKRRAHWRNDPSRLARPQFNLLTGLSSGRFSRVKKALVCRKVKGRLKAIPRKRDVKVDVINCICGRTDEFGLMIQVNFISLFYIVINLLTSLMMGGTMIIFFIMFAVRAMHVLAAWKLFPN